MGKTRRRILAVAVIATVASITGLVAADEESDRNSLIREIDDLLGSATSELNDAASGSAGKVEQARRWIQAIPSKLSSLEKVKGSDSKANNYVSRYPRFVEDFDRATRPLIELKNNEKSLTDLSRKCQDLDRQLQEQASRFERDKDGERIEELRRLAVDAGNRAEQWWRDAERTRDQTTRWGDDARRFSVSDDRWDYVTRALHTTTLKALDNFGRDLKDAESACKDLRQRDRHPMIERVLRELANTAKGKDALYAQLEDRLKRAESAIKDFATDSKSSSKLSDAQGYMAEVERFVRDVDALKGADRKAEQIASKWPEYVSNFKPAATALRGLKDSQFDLDEAPQKCDAHTNALVGLLKAFVENKDPDGLIEGPRIANEIGEKYTRAISTMEAHRATMRGFVSTVAAYEPRDDRWTALRRQMKESAERMYEHWDKKSQEAHSRCDDLAKGAQSSLVTSFLAQITGNTQAALKAYQDAILAWKERVRVYKRRDCEEMTALWDALCGPLDFEPNEDEDKAAAWALSDQMVRGLLPGVADLLKEHETLKNRGEELQKKAKTRDEASRLLSSLREDHEKLVKLQSKSGWVGSNNPLIQFYISYGIQQHNRMMDDSSYSCDAKDVIFSSSRKRPDCVSGSHCRVFEFKPNNTDAKDAGERALRIYIRETTSYYQKHIDDRTIPDSAHGGSEVLKKLSSKCLDTNGKITLEGRVVTYDRCERRYECVQ